MQLVGGQFSDNVALAGNDISTLPDYPAEIRAPSGSLAGVSGYQIHFAGGDIFTPGDEVDALVAMNPAALKMNIKAVKRGGLVIVNSDSFAAADLKKAQYETNPLEDGSLAGFRVIPVPVNSINTEAVKPAGLPPRDVDRCKNFFTLGVIYWLYNRPLEPTLDYIQQKFGKKNPAVALANTLALKAGYDFGDNTELFSEQYQVPKAQLPPGRYRKITGNEAAALAMAAAAKLAGKELFYGSYPITPASEILQNLSDMKKYGVVTFQAEDEICAMGAAVGAAFGGAIAATGTSGPGVALKSEAMGLAVMTELPVVIVNVQRGGPSTGLPTKTEQADLYQVVFGRNGESPMPVLAATSPSDCFDITLEAFRIAVDYMTPVVVLTDGYIANSSEPWLVPDLAKMPKIEAKHPVKPNDDKGFMPYKRDEKGVRPWAVPGTAGLEHRIGGLEKADGIGTISYDAANHEKMVKLRNDKVANIKPAGPAYLWTGDESGDVLVIGWGGTHGAIKAATLEMRKGGLKVSCCQIRYLNPLPEDLGPKLKAFKQVLVPELNLGQLRMMLRAKYLIDPSGLSKVRGQPFTISEIMLGVQKCLDGLKSGK